MSLVETLISRFGRELELVSGGCPRGADDFAEQASRIYGVPIRTFPVDRSTPIEHRGEFARRAYARNRQVAEHADVVYAWVAPDRTGGTENTITHARELGKRVTTVDEDGRLYLEHEGGPDQA